MWSRGQCPVRAQEEQPKVRRRIRQREQQEEQPRRSRQEGWTEELEPRKGANAPEIFSNLFASFDLGLRSHIVPVMGVDYTI
jgi:hypothetical protein